MALSVGPIRRTIDAIEHGVGKAAKGLFKGAVAVGAAGAKGVGKVGLATAKVGAKGGEKGLEIIGEQSAGFAANVLTGEKGLGKVVNNAANATARTAMATGEKLVNHTRESYRLNHSTGEIIHNNGKVGLSILGWGALLGSGMVASARDGADEHMTRLMGQTDGQRYTATADMNPRQYSYVNNGGATGDLVFALNANRRG